MESGAEESAGEIEVSQIEELTASQFFDNSLLEKPSKEEVSQDKDETVIDKNAVGDTNLTAIPKSCVESVTADEDDAQSVSSDITFSYMSEKTNDSVMLKSEKSIIKNTNQNVNDKDKCKDNNEDHTVIDTRREEVNNKDYTVIDTRKEEVDNKDYTVIDTRIEEVNQRLTDDLESSLLREKLCDMHSNLIELQISNAKLKFEQEGLQEDLENYRRRILITLHETKELLQNTLILEEGNTYLMKVKDELEIEKKKTYEEMIEKMLLSKKAIRNSFENEMALMHLSRAYENERFKCKQTLSKIENTETIIRKISTNWNDLVGNIRERINTIKKRNESEISLTKKISKKVTCLTKIKKFKPEKKASVLKVASAQKVLIKNSAMLLRSSSNVQKVTPNVQKVTQNIQKVNQNVQKVPQNVQKVTSNIQKVPLIFEKVSENSTRQETTQKLPQKRSVQFQKPVIQKPLVQNQKTVIPKTIKPASSITNTENLMKKSSKSVKKLINDLATVGNDIAKTPTKSESETISNKKNDNNEPIVRFTTPPRRKVNKIIN